MVLLKGLDGNCMETTEHRSQVLQNQGQGLTGVGFIDYSDAGYPDYGSLFLRAGLSLRDCRSRWILHCPGGLQNIVIVHGYRLTVDGL